VNKNSYASRGFALIIFTVKQIKPETFAGFAMDDKKFYLRVKKRGPVFAWNLIHGGRYQWNKKKMEYDKL